MSTKSKIKSKIAPIIFFASTTKNNHFIKILSLWSDFCLASCKMIDKWLNHTEKTITNIDNNTNRFTEGGNKIDNINSSAQFTRFIKLEQICPSLNVSNELEWSIDSASLINLPFDFIRLRIKTNFAVVLDRNRRSWKSGKRFKDLM